MARILLFPINYLKLGHYLVVERFCKYPGYLFMQLQHSTAMEPSDMPGKRA
jgi:hypothetical protein